MTKLKMSLGTTKIVSLDENGKTSTQIWISRTPEYGPSSDAPGRLQLRLPVRDDEKIILLSRIDTELPNFLEAVTLANEYRLTVQPTTEYDVIGSISVTSGIPLPLDVIEDHVSENPASEPLELQALADDNGFVYTLVLVAPTGMYARYSRTWVLLNSLDVIEDLDVFVVGDGAVSLYDQYDQVGRQIHIASLPVTDVNDAARAESKVSVVAAVRELRDQVEDLVADTALPVIASAKDLLAFVKTAEEDSSVRWYAEKRARALGLDDSNLPWLGDS